MVACRAGMRGLLIALQPRQVDEYNVGTKCSPAHAAVANPTDHRHTATGTAYLDYFRLALAHGSSR